ncbi:hypothetical protein EGW08_002691 [Elysia chlorotica]|uniref:C2 domain-containing protein n=1 Tax=Elysia chlorotica TaxID=188477 RepID=A0A3S0ZY55_ELYCH|nr:hypothetical protein EGW08_002691 [Elysia chlorotica]
MFGKKKSSEPHREPGRRKGTDLMNQMGFGAMPGLGDIDAMVYGDDDDDEDLEAELAALAGESSAPKKAKPKRRAPVPMADIESLAKAGMEDLDDDVSDTEDPDLMAELEELQSEEEEEVQAPPVKSPNLSPQKAPGKSTDTSAPSRRSPNPVMFEPTLIPSSSSSSSSLSNQVRQPSPNAQRVLPSPSPKPSPSPSPRPSPSHSTSGGGGGGGMVGLLEERLSMYQTASANAKSAADSSKQRRLDRGIKTLAGLLRQAKAGKPVNEEEIPPAVAMGASVALAEPPKPAADCKEALVERRDQYRKAAVMAKRAGDMAKASSYVKVSKQFDAVIQAIDEGKEIDLSKMPPPPTEFSGESVHAVSSPQPAVAVERVSQQAAGEDAEPDLPSMSAEEEKSMFNAPDAPQSVMEALTQRLDKYKSSESSAKAAGESSKARRMGRIVKQYEDAIKMHRAGKPVDFEELPTPPGELAGPSPAATPAPRQAPAPPAPRPAPRNPPSEGQSQPGHPGPQAGHPSAPGGATAAAATRPQPIQRQNTGRKSMHSRQEQQLAFLKERMSEFKQAAMQAKKNHDLELAKQYVRMMKGMEPMIDACESGLPVDLAQVPPSPIGADDAEDKFVVVSAENCQPTGDREEVFKNLQGDLVRQIRLCVANTQHYQKLGDVPAAAKFQKLEQNCRRDLESLKSAYRHADPAPRFHYETRSFSMVQSNTELGDADMELTIVRGIQYNLPSGYSEKDMDTCVKYEFAFPTDEPQTGGTGTVKDTVNPEYNETFRLQINRKSKGLFRFVERKGIKLEIFIKRGFFKGDKLLGTVNVKLQPLENKCTVHDSYDLMDGRKTVGGKLEVKLRIRDPLKTKQVEEVKEKWLVIDQFIRTVGSKVGNSRSYEGTTCMEVLRLEKQMLDKQISQLKDGLSLTQTQALRHKSALIEEKLELQQKKLREGGIDAWRAYLAVVRKEVVSFEQEARQYARFGEVQKAELFMNKKKCAEKEMAAIAAKIPNA